jgi:hypothetical protein
VRQLAGAFAHGAVEFEAAWLALVDKSSDKSPQSKRCRVGKTPCRMDVPRVRLPYRELPIIRFLP